VARGDEETLVLRSNPARRLLFLAIAVLLIVGFVLGFDWGEGFSGTNVGGSIFYFLLVVVSLGVASWRQETVFARREKVVRFRKHLLLMRLQDDEVPLSSITAVILQTVRLIKGREDHVRDFQRGGVFSQMMQRRNTFFRLFLETEKGKLLVEDSSDPGDLSELGTSISQFLGITYRTEEI
jgi:hypothetical protein